MFKFKKNKNKPVRIRPKFKEDEYNYASAKISAMEAKLPSDRDILALCDLESQSALSDRINELGIRTDKACDSLEDQLSSALEEMYTTLCSFLPDSEVSSIMRARFDCHNLKTAAKCFLIGIDPRPFFMKGGEYAFDVVIAAAENRDFSAFPKIIAEAAASAFEAINTNSQARTVDVILDRACFEYMLNCAIRLGCPEISRLLAIKTDCTNLLIRLRICSMKNKETALVLLKDSLLNGGYVSCSDFASAESPEEICALFCKNVSPQRAKLVKQYGVGASSYDGLSAVLDSIFLSETYDICHGKLIGIYPVIEYIVKYEFIIKNIRIIAGGINSGKNPDDIRAEVRAYV